MNIKILTDSTCDLPKPILDACGIDLTPLTVVKDGAEFKDGITITPAEIFAHVAAGGALCSTSAVSVGEYLKEGENELVMFEEEGSDGSLVVSFDDTPQIDIY